MLESDKIKELENKIQELESQLSSLKHKQAVFFTDQKTVSVPAPFQPIFDEAEKTVAQFFDKIKISPSEAKIEINDERYLLLRASSLSVDFLTKIKELYSDKGEEEALLVGKNLLFDLAHVIGIEDANKFHTAMNLKDPVAKLSAGPVHFAYSGWAYVDILPESNPEPNDNFFLKYHHPFSFEADSWLKEKNRSKVPVCIMNAGYSSGWCEESFGIPLTAVEISCRAKGDENCTFIMAPPHKIDEYLPKSLAKSKMIYDVPSFFERKKAEEKIKNALTEKDVLIKEIHHRVKNNLQIISSMLNLQNQYIDSEELRVSSADTINRIKTMALVHEKLHNAENVEYVDLRDYLSSIAYLLKQTFLDSTIELNILGVDTKEMHIDLAMPIGLIVNELISNSLKYAFNDESGEITLELIVNNDGVEIKVGDNGVGVEADFLTKPADSLGMELVEALADQINATLSLESSNKGTMISIQVPF